MTEPKRRIYRTEQDAHTTAAIAEFFDSLGKRVFLRSETRSGD